MEYEPAGVLTVARQGSYMTEATGIVGEFLTLKAEADADVLAMQVGDFYEFFDDDAMLVGEELDLKVSKKSSGGEKYPMAGVPVDELTPYLTALVERGYRVAVADQREEGDGHIREVTRVVTPGTLLETTRSEARYIAGVVGDGDAYGLAFADATTGQFHATSVGGREADERAVSELCRFDPVEVLPGPDARNDEGLLDRLQERLDADPTLYDPEAFAPGHARHRAREQFGEGALAALDLRDVTVRAVGAVLSYVEATGAGVLRSMTRLQPYGPDDHVALDATTRRNLELTETMRGDSDGSLFETVDHTVTSPGGRLLREWLCRPRRDRRELDRRLDCVEALAAGALAREELREVLGSAYDLERLTSKAAHGSAGPQDLLAVRETLALLPTVSEVLDGAPDLSSSPLPAVLDEVDRAAADAVHERLAEALVDDPPASIGDGGTFRKGYDSDLDGVIAEYEEAREWIDGLADREKRRTGLSRLRVDRNRTDGYYIQVGNSQADRVPDEYERVKSLKNAERFTTRELDEREREILRLEERRGEMERELFRELRTEVADRSETLQDVGRALAELDVVASLANHAVEADWTRPTLADPGRIEIDAGRHPVVERTTEFVPNDADLGDDRGVLLVTGPNMSGKSTYMRQVALITLLAQVGSFVPAERAEIGVVDGIYTRVGALDELAQGRSTFMVEMAELSNILHSATEESLVILDEVGRGTATYDGISIAWAATEYLHNEVRANTLFATHYHELTALADHLPRVANVHVAVDERDGDVTFLRTVRDGPTNRSYGVHVAELAGVPEPVVDRADEVLDRLREDKAIEARGGTDDAGSRQVVFDLEAGRMRADDDGAEVNGVDPKTESILAELDDLDVNETPPIELLATVQEWQRRRE